ncbi:hypothetical protein FB45DRAFT_941758 [Roridomyces roridus]|uniref:Uncharacterized protein n=1 Tax=Roridomyces roridus TaxID=1738132 RepID=A0AAD7B5W1_9AGAR|nr:hypothetical protein FB45DRAFT_941758 [Roridomyces roridus]
MKISSSSSLLFALAISTSSSSLAAPAGEPSTSEAGLTSSPSGHDLASRRDSMAGRNLRPSNMQESIEQARSTDHELEERGKLLDILGLSGLACGVLDSLATCDAAPSGKQALLAQRPSNQEAIQVLQSVIHALQSDSSDSSPDASRQDDGDDEPESGDDDEDDGAEDGEPDDDDDDDDEDGPSSPVAAADYAPTTSSSSSLPTNPPNTPEMSSTSASAEPTGGLARRDTLPVPPLPTGVIPPLPVTPPSLPDTVAPPVLPVPLPTPTVPVALPVGGLPPVPVALSPVPAVAVPGPVISNVGTAEKTVDEVKAIVMDADNLVRRAAQAPLPVRRWMSRRQVPPQVPAPAAGAPGTATSVVLDVPSVVTAKAGSTVPSPVSQNAGVVAGTAGGALGTAEGDVPLTVSEGGAHMGTAKGVTPAPATGAATTVGSAAGGGVETVGGVVGGSPAPAPAKGVAGNVASNA